MTTIEKKQECISKINGSDLSDDDKAFIIDVLNGLEEKKSMDLMKILSYLRTGVDIVKIIKYYLGDDSGDS